MATLGISALMLSRAMQGPDSLTESHTDSVESDVPTVDISSLQHRKRPSGLVFRSQEPFPSFPRQPTFDRVLDQKQDPESLYLRQRSERHARQHKANLRELKRREENKQRKANRARQKANGLSRHQPRFGEHAKHLRSREEGVYDNVIRIGTRAREAYLREEKRLEENKRKSEIVQERKGLEMGGKLSLAQQMQQHQELLRRRVLLAQQGILDHSHLTPHIPPTSQQIYQMEANMKTRIGGKPKKWERSLDGWEGATLINAGTYFNWFLGDEYIANMELDSEGQLTAARDAETTPDNKVKKRQGLNTEVWKEVATTITKTPKLNSSESVADKVNRSSPEWQMWRWLGRSGPVDTEAVRGHSSSLSIKRTISEDCTGAPGNERPSKLQCLKKEALRHEQPHVDHLKRAESSRPTKRPLMRPDLLLAALRP
ncbi:hypothetical protein BJY01DRAFT_217881 [Aspergillus pseudoustus]|uniref:Uncharacterized protein n=1 Tax=Aspergillus pseudoustus TaxID=1810923 RepID=A0ABR4JM83_9EURO